MQPFKGFKKNAQIARPFVERWYGLLLVLFMGYVIADLLIVGYRDLMLPSQSAQLRLKAPPPNPGLSREAFQSIIKRNLFSSLDQIPPELVGKNEEQKTEQVPVLTTLPLNLIGTLVHSSPEKSIAAIEVKSKANQVISYSPGREIENLATVEKIERGRVIIRNINTGRLEYIELAQNAKVSFGAAGPKGDPGDVKKVAPNTYEISRTELNKYTSDLSGILMKARAVPARKPGTGEIYGWRILDMEADSIYTRLGLQKGDVITGVNGNAVTSPQQAMEMYQALKGAPGIQLQLERGGKNETLKFDVKQ